MTTATGKCDGQREMRRPSQGVFSAQRRRQQDTEIIVDFLHIPAVETPFGCDTFGSLGPNACELIKGSGRESGRRLTNCNPHSHITIAAIHLL